MVHVRKCPLGKRSKPTTEFYIDDKPQIYCLGYIDRMNDEPLPTCVTCMDFACGEQCEEDFRKAHGHD